MEASTPEASVTNNLNASRTQSFTYDQVNRIISAGTSATTGTYCWGYQFSYDAWGNLLTQAGWAPTYNSCVQGVLPGVTADGNNHISMFAYDAAGNATGDSTYTYTWDGESQLKSAAGVNYLYDGDGRRVSKSNGKLYWYSPSGEIITETDATGHKLEDYIFFAGKHIGNQSSSGVGSFYVEDSLGSSRVLTSTAGVVCYDADFTPYGGEHAYTNTCPQNYKFEGKERDTETGNDDFGARYYNNRFGRWLSADWSAVPIAVPYANLSNPQTLNLYSMVSDDPESFADLDGHDGFDDAVSGVIKTLTNLTVGFINASTGGPRLGAAELPMQTASNNNERAAMIATNVAAVVVPVVGEISTAETAGVVLSEAQDVAASVRGSAAEAADAEQAGGRTSGTSAALRTSDGTTYTAESGGGGANHPEVQKALDNVPASERSAYHGCCAEIKNLNQAKNAGKDVSGATASAAKIRKPGHPAHGQPKTPCTTCQNVNKQLGVTQ